MRRREFLAGSIALAAGKTALPSSTWAQSATRINRIIDAHCHIFNAADLPIEGFTKKIMVPKSAQTSELVARFADYPGALEALVHARLLFSGSKVRVLVRPLIENTVNSEFSTTANRPPNEAG